MDFSKIFKFHILKGFMEDSEFLIWFGKYLLLCKFCGVVPNYYILNTQKAEDKVIKKSERIRSFFVNWIWFS